MIYIHSLIGSLAHFRPNRVCIHWFDYPNTCEVNDNQCTPYPCLSNQTENVQFELTWSQREEELVKGKRTNSLRFAIIINQNQCVHWTRVLGRYIHPAPAPNQYRRRPFRWSSPFHSVNKAKCTGQHLSPFAKVFFACSPKVVQEQIWLIRFKMERSRSLGLAPWRVNGTVTWWSLHSVHSSFILLCVRWEWSRFGCSFCDDDDDDVFGPWHDEWTSVDNCQCAHWDVLAHSHCGANVSCGLGDHKRSHSPSTGQHCCVRRGIEQIEWTDSISQQNAVNCVLCLFACLIVSNWFITKRIVSPGK